MPTTIIKEQEPPMSHANGSIGRKLLAMTGTAIAGSALLVAALAPSHADASPMLGTAIIGR